MPPTKGHLILRRPVPSTRGRATGRRRVRRATTLVATRVRRVRRRLARVLAISKAATSSTAASRILRITGIVVTISSRWQRLFRRCTELVRSLLPTLAVVVAGVRARARGRSRFMELAPSLLVSRSPDYPTLRDGTATAAFRRTHRSLHPVSVLEDLVQGQLRRRHGTSATRRRHGLVLRQRGLMIVQYRRTKGNRHRRRFRQNGRGRRADQVRRPGCDR